jgi:hypothetical protein
MSKRTRFPEIRAELRQREASSREMRQCINDSSGLERWQAWQDKRTFGADTRALLLTYAILRGMPYRVVEPRIANDVQGIEPTHNFWHGIGFQIKTNSERFGHPLTEEQIMAWAKTPAVTETAVAA